MRFFETKNVKRTRYFYRLMHDFPWLWAIKQRWVPAWDDVQVRILGEGQLSEPIAGPPDKSYHREIWIKLALGGLEDIQRVTRIYNWTGTVAQAILSHMLYYGTGYLLQHVIFDEIVQENEQRIVIFRAPRGKTIHQMFVAALEG